MAIGYLFLVDFPDRAAKTSWAFLNERECQFIIRRIAKDRSDAELEPFNLKKWAASGLDLKIWGFALIFFSITTQAYAIAYFLPIIPAAMAYQANNIRGQWKRAFASATLVGFGGIGG